MVAAIGSITSDFIILLELFEITQKPTVKLQDSVQ